MILKVYVEYELHPENILISEVSPKIIWGKSRNPYGIKDVSSSHQG
ncbi:hypothetical protein NIES2100_03180 [Calothrix sp. NIES-2100]|nr:hypothetical protein NIES2100_03180 [Calothrix sp. NIES-2100]